MQTGSFLATVVLLGICGASDAGLATHDSPVQPALDLITRNFGPNAAAAFTLELKPSVPCSAANETAQAPCFSLKLINGKVVVTASSMAELTYGIGHYTRFQCGLTVGWARGGNSYSNIPGLSWPCHQQEFQSVALARVVPYTYQDNVCTHSYSYVWYDESAWMTHIDWMALQVFPASTLGVSDILFNVSNFCRESTSSSRSLDKKRSSTRRFSNLGSRTLISASFSMVRRTSRGLVGSRCSRLVLRRCPRVATLDSLGHG